MDGLGRFRRIGFFLGFFWRTTGVSCGVTGILGGAEKMGTFWRVGRMGTFRKGARVTTTSWGGMYMGNKGCFSWYLTYRKRVLKNLNIVKRLRERERN